MEIVTVLVDTALRAVQRAPQLVGISVLFWSTVAVGLGVRYLGGDRAQRRRRSDRVLRVTPLIGVVAVTAAALDLVGGTPVQVVHPSMVAYLALPLGVGRRVLARLDAAVWEHRLRRDRTPAAELGNLGARLVTYVLAIAGNTALSVVNGDPYRLFTSVELDETDPAAAMASVNWLHLLAFAFTLAVVADAVVTLSRVWQQRGAAGADRSTATAVTA